MPYQDVWVGGKLLQKGRRECAARYAAIREVCSGLDPCFSVLDIGANLCYFGIRITEDFPGAHVLALDHMRHDRTLARLRASGADRVVLMRHKLTAKSARSIAAMMRFDVVLALSVLHHLSGSFEEWMAILRRLGRNVVAEFAGEDSTAAQLPEGYAVPHDAQLLAMIPSHLNPGVTRPLVLIPGE